MLFKPIKLELKQGNNIHVGKERVLTWILLTVTNVTWTLITAARSKRIVNVESIGVPVTTFGWDFDRLTLDTSGHIMISESR